MIYNLFELTSNGAGPVEIMLQGLLSKLDYEEIIYVKHALKHWESEDIRERIDKIRERACDIRYDINSDSDLQYITSCIKEVQNNVKIIIKNLISKQDDYLFNFKMDQCKQIFSLTNRIIVDLENPTLNNPRGNNKFGCGCLIIIIIIVTIIIIANFT